MSDGTLEWPRLDVIDMSELNDILRLLRKTWEPEPFDMCIFRLKNDGTCTFDVAFKNPSNSQFEFNFQKFASNKE